MILLRIIRGQKRKRRKAQMAIPIHYIFRPSTGRNTIRKRRKRISIGIYRCGMKDGKVMPSFIFDVRVVRYDKD